MTLKSSPRMRLELVDGTAYEGFSFGADTVSAGEVVFNTGMVGYPESLTDPSYSGEILVLTYPLIGNYGVPAAGENRLNTPFESERIQISGLIVSSASVDYSHVTAVRSLGDWLKEYNIPAMFGVDTRALTKRLREHGTMLGRLVTKEKEIPFSDPNLENLVAKVSTPGMEVFGSGKKTVLLIDCGCKNNIIRSLVDRGCRVVRVAWNYDISGLEYDGIFLSNGPGDPKQCKVTVENIRKAFQGSKPIFGICLGNQLLALAAGADTYKLKYGHRGQNQPCREVGGPRCLITSQNHGYAVSNDTLPKDWEVWFVNANDGTNEGIRHKSKPFMGVQFHPEATPGPTDAAFLFDEFVKML